MIWISRFLTLGWLLFQSIVATTLSTVEKATTDQMYLRNSELVEQTKLLFQELQENPFAASIPSSSNRKLASLSDDCLDKMCQMLESVFTCEVFEISWEKICAKYILGYLYSCPIYPSPSKITDAPSICLDEIQGLVNDQPPIKEIATSPTRGEDCHLNCYQTYLERSISFWQQCGADVNVTEYDRLENLAPLETYREQACAYDRFNNDSNCVDLLLQLAPTPSPVPAPTKPPSPDLLFSYTCLPNPTPYVQLCGALLAPMGCCMANQIAILTSINQTLAPCTMDYIYKYCPTTVDLTNFCPNGTLQDLGTVQVLIKLNFPATQGLPKMSSYDGYIYFRAVVTKILNLSPLQVVVLSYTYYNGTTSLGQKYTGATNGEFRYQIMVSGTTKTSFEATLNTMRTQVYPASIAAGYGKPATVVTQFTIEKTEYYVADPIVIEKNSGGMMMPWGMLSSSLLSAAIAMILFFL